jgi:predicted DNA-binding ribbon-helix-helix protein
MIRKTMRVGDVRTSIKLEAEFWDYLKEVADDRKLRLSHLVNEVSRATPGRTNLASTLRTFCLLHAHLRIKSQGQELEKLHLAGSSQDLVRAIDAMPLPCLLLAEDRTIRRLNRAFAQWLNLDERGVLGQRIDNILILRAPGMRELWQRLFGGQARRGAFSATYVSPGRVRTAQATAIGLAPQADGAHKASLILFETLAART